MPAQEIRALTNHFQQPGRVEAIYLRTARVAPVTSVCEVHAEPGRGLIGDRRSARISTGKAAQKREVTLFQAEHLSAIGSWLGMSTLDAGRLRRNLVVSGINLIAMRSPWPDIGLEWCIGEEVVLQITGSCDPCSRMEAELGFGGYNAMRGHGGVTARVIAGGIIRVGDSVHRRVSSD